MLISNNQENSPPQRNRTHPVAEMGSQVVALTTEETPLGGTSRRAQKNPNSTSAPTKPAVIRKRKPATLASSSSGGDLLAPGSAVLLLLPAKSPLTTVPSQPASALHLMAAWCGFDTFATSHGPPNTTPGVATPISETTSTHPPNRVHHSRCSSFENLPDRPIMNRMPSEKESSTRKGATTKAALSKPAIRGVIAGRRWNPAYSIPHRHRWTTPVQRSAIPTLPSAPCTSLPPCR